MIDNSTEKGSSLSDQDLEKGKAIESSKGEFVELKKKLKKEYTTNILKKVEKIHKLSTTEEKIREAKKLILSLQKDKTKSSIDIQELLKTMIMELEREEKKLEEERKERKERKKREKGKGREKGKNTSERKWEIEDFLIDSKKLAKEINSKFISTLMKDEDKRLFDIPSQEANHRIISKYLWKQADKEDFILTENIIKNQLLNTLMDSYRNELIGEKKGLEIYMTWKAQLEKVFSDTLGELYPYFQGSSLLSFTESRFVAKDNNEYTAGGFFQITDKTAKEIHIEENKFINKKKDPLESARGAATYLKKGFNKWYDRGLYYNYKDNIDYNKITRYTIKKGDTIRKISSKFKVDEKVIIDINQLNSKQLKIGKEIFIPTPDSYIIEDEEREEVKQNSVSLSLAGYNGNIVENLGEIASYNDYLDKFSALMKATKKAGDALAYIKYSLSLGNNDIKKINSFFMETINIYKSINTTFLNGKYWNKRIRLLEKYMLADLPLEEKKQILMYLLHSKENNLNINIAKTKKISDYTASNLHMKRWFTSILTQNLLYPANLWAMQKLNNRILSGKEKVITLENEEKYYMDVITIKEIDNLNHAITLRKIASKLNININKLKELNPHIKKSVYNLGLSLPVNIYLPKNYGNKIEGIFPYNITTKKLYKKQIRIHKSQIKRGERQFRELSNDNGTKEFSYTIQSYDTISDIEFDLKKNGFKIVDILDKKGQKIEDIINPGSQITIIAKKENV